MSTKPSVTAGNTPPTSPSPKKLPLFRPEVGEALTSNWLGSIRLKHTMSGTVVAAVALSIAGALVAFVALGSFTQKARVGGLVVPVNGALAVTTPQAGTLVRALVAEGSTVKAGDLLFELSSERQQSGGELGTLIAQQLTIRREALQLERTARIAMAREKQRAIEARIANAEAEQVQLGNEIKLATRRKGLAQQSVSKYETLQASGFVSQAQTQQKQEDLIDIEARLSALARSQSQLASTLVNLRAEREQLGQDLDGELAQFRRAEATLEQEAVQNRDRRRTLVVAPQAGTLTALNYHIGQALSAGQSLATLVPGAADGAALEANLYAPSRTAGFVKPGQKVLIRYQAFPYQKFGLHGGEIVDVSRTPFAPSELPANIAGTILGTVSRGASNEALYRIRVKLDRQAIQVYGDSLAVKPGMTLEADIVQDQRKIWEWIAEPLIAIAPRQKSNE
ncbi:HlyD family efflux transporter periplasmic adaptor subunit [Pseudoduganella sp. DS3]|uniref:HlyD family efflux transporter periplasmic adaptor subunit n=1 Tax=Pseudoduganella guangdongensis TaxID=2692179 RepID=A0A6N9HEL7_9BURK|nr:HlyD family efflux transporter periplasmic adaptor subunit [Pseudoduganella guangdongensis]MYN01493.1 HlyD family efflux transporter periplasmic adaptor subunit [Pseudoduganella guangdongensis]